MGKKRYFLTLALVLAMTLPTVVTYLYFIVLATDANQPNPVQQIVYVLGKVVQFSLPVAAVWFMDRRFPWPSRPRLHGVILGTGFGLLVAVGMLGLYFGWLADSSILGSTPQLLKNKVTQIGLTTPLRYWCLAVFYTVGHALFEEYYYRWFIFGQLRKMLSFWPAVLLASLAFMAHHVILLYHFLPESFFIAVVPFSLAIAVGGAFWAWLYERTGTIYAAWVSHGIVDAAIFFLGWILLQRLGA
jgi:membrane protease YdiL (CAAX protease family)